ncbi:GNAT family N-acetyltransferase [Bradyrhizobium sp. AUGA SZCCT0283]|jgi:RimJ/RimL family protein N-acetyltransferase|uniref:GNAT family N-acetyltransferase n=1 Tax=Bradyrhizobium sp. AUGA SZCCT0283 TaxID=2807671 RepID=UPI002012F470|nr:GNAT family N-acetyltransferase [Bradyrhizobium sp. AUGA SZCCT0283]
MAVPLLSARELRYCGLMDQKPAPVSEQPPLVILRTPRLILRAAVEEDISILQNLIFGDSDVMRFAFSGASMAREAAEDFIRRSFTFGENLTGMAVLTEKPAGEIIGFAGLSPCHALEADDFEIGFVLARRAWGRGIATEIGEAQLAFGFEQLKCGRLLGLVDPRNAPSIHALEKLGMRYVETIEEPKRGSRRIFVIEAAEWRRRRAE